MGQEIEAGRFRREDFCRFEECLQQETQILSRWFEQQRFCEGGTMVGFELESWLIDAGAGPAPVNAEFLQAMNDPLVVPELAAFNVELNSHPRVLQGRALSTFADELEQLWKKADVAARQVDARIIMMGILPTLQSGHLVLDNMSGMQRYRVLNEQVLRMREGRPLKLDIRGRETLHYEQRDVMLEAAATSFQLHLQVSQDEAVRFYNASKIVSAIMVAVSANSPYLWGLDLWDESRIPLFEQAVSVGDQEYSKRVSFGIRYANQSLLECFESNLHRYPILMPVAMEEDGSLPHLRLHNGTIWRWNRPLLGFDEQGEPHLRIEHRVIPAGPSVIDVIANAALYYGLVHYLARQEKPPEYRITFEMARDNFYAAARGGLQAFVAWDDGQPVEVRTLLLERLLAEAREGLLAVGVDAEDADRWLGVIEQRTESGMTGAAWQRAWVARYGADMAALTEACYQQQNSGLPVHEWSM